MDGSTDSDVVVVGGGVIGLACAHYLNLAGRAVRLLEQDRYRRRSLARQLRSGGRQLPAAPVHARGRAQGDL